MLLICLYIIRVISKIGVSHNFTNTIFWQRIKLLISKWSWPWNGSLVWHINGCLSAYYCTHWTRYMQGQQANYYNACLPYSYDTCKASTLNVFALFDEMSLKATIELLENCMFTPNATISVCPLTPRYTVHIVTTFRAPLSVRVWLRHDQWFQKKPAGLEDMSVGS